MPTPRSLSVFEEPVARVPMPYLELSRALAYEVFVGLGNCMYLNLCGTEHNYARPCETLHFGFHGFLKIGMHYVRLELAVRCVYVGAGGTL